MAKDPAFLFYPNDYIGGTMGMTFEQKGAYMELLMMQFNRGHMTTHMIGQTIGQLWVKVQVKFIQDGKGLWYNERLEEEQDKRREFTKSRRNNVSGTNQHSKKKKKEVGHMTTHMVNVNKDDNVVKKEKEFKEEILSYSNEYDDLMLNDFFNYWSEWNKSKSKMRWQLEKTWQTDRRIATWFKRSQTFNKSGASKKELYPGYKESSFD